MRLSGWAGGMVSGSLRFDVLLLLLLLGQGFKSIWSAPYAATAGVRNGLLPAPVLHSNKITFLVHHVREYFFLSNILSQSFLFNILSNAGLIFNNLCRHQ
jgi:hypothetical protein